MKIYPVKITIGDIQKVYRAEFQISEKYYKAWKNVLKHAYRRGKIECLCPGKDERLLAIRYFSDLDKYYLSRYPETGYNHAEDCRFYGEDKALVHATEGAAVEELSDGTARIRLEHGIKERDAYPKEQSQAVDIKRPHLCHTSTKKPNVTLLNLFKLLWDKAALNNQEDGVKWHDMATVAQRIRKAADTVITKSAKISEVLVIAGDSEDTNRKIITNAIEKKMRPIIIAPIAKWTQEREDLAKGYLALSYFQGIPHVKLSKELWEHTKKKFPEAIEAWKSGKRVTAIIQADTPKSIHTVVVIDIAITRQVRLG